MADKMMRMAGRGEDGRSKAIKSDNEGSISVKTFNQVNLLRTVPTNVHSDVTMGGNVEPSTSDFVIRDTNEHVFIVPMAVKGYRSIVASLSMMPLDGGNFDQPFKVIVRGMFGWRVSDYASNLMEITTHGNSFNRFSIGTSEVGLGGTEGKTLVTGNDRGHHFYVPAISDGFPYIGIVIKFDIAPTQGAINFINLSRMSL